MGRLYAVVCCAAMLAACGDSGGTMDAGDSGRDGATTPDMPSGGDAGDMGTMPDMPVTPDMGGMDMTAMDTGTPDMGDVDMGAPDMGTTDPLCAEALAMLDCASGTVSGTTAMGAATLGDYCDYMSDSWIGNEAVYGFASTTTQRVTISFDALSSTGDWDLFAYDPGTLGCDANRTCVATSESGDPDEALSFLAAPGHRYYVSFDQYASAGNMLENTPFTVTVTCVAPGCGDGFLDPGELCDDGNTATGDGCSDICSLESGSWCTFDGTATPQSSCHPVVCGDGNTEADERCDDGGTAPGDGCSPTCTVETGFTCDWSSSSTCAAPACGDGMLEGAEACDDGGTSDGDGCSATCTVEAGYGCRTYGTFYSVCNMLTCGDGTRFFGEVCDDGNTTDGDGCSAACGVEAGYACESSTPSLCATPTCGDGTRTAGETCDDGNTVGSDGCSATCQVESPLDIPATGGTATYRGVLDSGDATFTRPYEDCAPRTGTPVAYDQFVLHNPDATARTVDLTVSASGDSYMFVYETPLDATMPTARCLEGNDQWGYNHSRIEHVTIPAGGFVTVVVTEWDVNTSHGAYALIVDAL